MQRKCMGTRRLYIRSNLLCGTWKLHRTIQTTGQSNETDDPEQTEYPRTDGATRHGGIDLPNIVQSIQHKKLKMIERAQDLHQEPALAVANL